MSGIRVIPADLRGVFCRRGTYDKAVSMGIDWSRFIREGIPIEELERYDDALVKKLIDRAKQRVAAENNHG